MRLTRNHEQTLKDFVDSVQDVLTRIEEVQEKLEQNNDTAPETRGHQTYQQLRYWFNHDGQLKPNN